MAWLRRWFWSPLREQENSAQTLVRVLGNLFRIVLTIVVAGIAVIVGAILYSSEQATRSFAEERAREAKLTLDVSHRDGGAGKYSGILCADEFPLAVTLINATDKALTDMKIRLTGRERGRSTNALEYQDTELTWNSVVPPQHALTMCYALVTRNAAQLVYTAEPDYYFRLVDPEPWMINETDASPLPQSN